jgi:xanthosine utilization system XapX-like protein
MPAAKAVAGETLLWPTDPTVDVNWVRSDCVPHVFAELPTNPTPRPKKSEVSA